jgi:hypothetical protein
MIKLFVRSMTLKPYPKVDIGAFEVSLTNEEYGEFRKAKDNKGKAKIILSALKTERDREDALALWLNNGKLTPEEVNALRYGVEEDLAAEAAAEADAMAELLDAGYDVEEDPQPIVEEKPKKVQRKRRSKKDEEVL